MDRTDVIIVLIAVLAMVVAAKPLKSEPFWLTVVLAAVSYPLGKILLSALESAAGTSSTWASYVFTISVGLVFATLGLRAVQGFTSFRGTRADRRHHDQEIDA
ncbi:hypothetical protein [Streptomyces zagrosensis]|uniref:Integral membrane protein n=1 Tax=Streptomyces zagrosensis TaxID=1042984 RepID=A0A7W9QCR7_9ACTN|nr:hypothetical protein [Streptomyces zagrosensis]MBB5937699.1 hypothetical protein [Streptomyces zagrosensis]